MIGKIIGTGKYIPSNVLTNDDLSRMVETNDEWITERTGIKKRHIVKDETTTQMAISSSLNAIENANINVEEIDMIVVATLTPDSLLPNISSRVQEAIGADNAVSMDLNGACVGFLMAYQLVQSYFNNGDINCALIVGAESLSKIINYQDRTNCILFGDGSGAAVLKAGEGKVASVMHTDAKRGKVLTCRSGIGSDKGFVEMDGQEVFKFATREVPKVIKEVLNKADEKIEDIDYFILHQANKRIIDLIAKKLKVDINKMPINIEEYGNTSSASIPILLDDLNREGKLKKGQKLIVSGFGGGLSYGASYLEL